MSELPKIQMQVQPDETPLPRNKNGDKGLLIRIDAWLIRCLALWAIWATTQIYELRSTGSNRMVLNGVVQQDLVEVKNKIEAVNDKLSLLQVQMAAHVGQNKITP